MRRRSRDEDENNYEKFIRLEDKQALVYCVENYSLLQVKQSLIYYWPLETEWPRTG